MKGYFRASADDPILPLAVPRLKRQLSERTCLLGLLPRGRTSAKADVRALMSKGLSTDSFEIPWTRQSDPGETFAAVVSPPPAPLILAADDIQSRSQFSRRPSSIRDGERPPAAVLEDELDVAFLVSAEDLVAPLGATAVFLVE